MNPTNRARSIEEESISCPLTHSPGKRVGINYISFSFYTEDFIESHSPTPKGTHKSHKLKQNSFLSFLNTITTTTPFVLRVWVSWVSPRWHTLLGRFKCGEVCGTGSLFSSRSSCRSFELWDIFLFFLLQTLLSLFLSLTWLITILLLLLRLLMLLPITPSPNSRSLFFLWPKKEKNFCSLLHI